MAAVTARRFRLGSPATAIVLFVLVLALGVASLPLAGLAGRAAGNDTGSTVAVALLSLALASRQYRRRVDRRPDGGAGAPRRRL